MTQPDLFGAPEAPPETSHQLLIRLFCEAYQQHFGVKYLFSGRDAKAAKELLGAGFFPDEIVGIAKAAWGTASDKRSFYAKDACTLHGLARRFNEVRSELRLLGAARGLNTLKVAAPVKGEKF